MPTVNVESGEKEINRCGMAYTDRVALITGGSAGIGEGIVRVFVDAGAVGPRLRLASPGT